MHQLALPLKVNGNMVNVPPGRFTQNVILNSNNKHSFHAFSASAFKMLRLLVVGPNCFLTTNEEQMDLKVLT